MRTACGSQQGSPLLQTCLHGCGDEATERGWADFSTKKGLPEGVGTAGSPFLELGDTSAPSSDYTLQPTLVKRRDPL